MERIEIVAKTLDEAIAKALVQLNTTRDKISVRIVEEGSKGIFGLGAKDAKIVVKMKEEEPVINQAAQDIVQEIKQSVTQPIQQDDAEPKAPVDTTEAQQKATAFISELIQKMEIDCQVSCKADGGSVRMILTGDGVGAAIGRRGETLDAIQYITNLYVNKGKHGDDYVRITVDTENYRAKREETLIRLANSMASKVVKYHKEMSLEPMNPYERRIIHSALQNHKYVKTRSIGDEPNRRVLITFKR